MLKQPVSKRKKMVEAAVAPRHAGFSVVRPIRNQKEFNAAVAELDRLADADPREDTATYDRLELLGILIAAYEADHTPPLKPASPLELVQFMAEQKGMGSSDLAEILGGRSRLSEFLNGSRELSKAQIVRLRDSLGIPADLLLN